MNGKFLVIYNGISLKQLPELNERTLQFKTTVDFFPELKPTLVDENEIVYNIESGFYSNGHAVFKKSDILFMCNIQGFHRWKRH